MPKSKAKPLQIVQRMEQADEVPPLSQSKFEAMACSLFYHARYIQGMDLSSEPARRGQEFHKHVSEYMETLRIDHVPTNYEKMAQIANGASAEVKELLETFGESHFYEPDKIYDMELYIGCDEEFRILEVKGRSERDMPKKPGIVYEGTIDVLIMESETQAVIEDFKTYFQIVDADSFQSKLYPLLVMLMNPTIESVRFILSFVRYGDAQREVTWTRGDIPYLKDMCERARGRQEMLHDTPVAKMKATPGRHCVFCPLLTSNCPLKSINPFEAMEPEERVAFAVWLNAAKRENDRIVKDWLAESGPIEYKDANGNLYTAEFVRQDRKSYPLEAAIGVLIPWFETHPKDRDHMAASLTVSGLSSPLKAEKRRELAMGLNDIATTKVVTRLKVGVAEDDEE